MAAMGEDLEQTKRRLRRGLLAARRDLSAPTATQLAVAVCRRVCSLAAFGAARHVVAYAPIDNEVDPAVALAAARAASKCIYFPRRSPAGLEFLRADPESLIRGAAGIPEPTGGVPLPEPDDAVLFLVPGVAFDPRGVRLGRGGGDYDRALSRHPAAVRIGLAYELQVASGLPEDPWDVRMDAVATELRLLESGLRRVA